MSLSRAGSRRLYHRRRRAYYRRRRYGRRRLRIPRIRRRFTVFHVKQTQNIPFTFWSSATPDPTDKWMSLSLESNSATLNKPKPGLNLRFAMFGDRLPGSGNAYHYPFDYYMIKLVKVELRPAFNPFQKQKTQGSTYIDKEGDITEVPATTPWSVDPYAAMSSRKTWTPDRYHKRVFIPKPTIQSSQTTGTRFSTWFVPGRRNMWINSTQDQVIHYGMGMSLRAPAEDAGAYPVECTVTFYIAFGQWTGLSP
ncbi:putative capsid protein [Swan circovirus]|uniref:Putative capsid protein n=1 Tax=Swan circovirus TaxID=459957 RepID=B0YPT5_9CIRC|nr:putative capsid protein [Swan circovirus]ABU48444.1 putative capsid protein [Swan circovirus]